MSRIEGTFTAVYQVVVEEWERKKPGYRGKKPRTETEVHNLTQLEIQNLLKEILQEKDKKLMIGFCITEI